jgi:hypothetical protein
LLSVLEFFGHFHPLLVHLPIGILLIALLLEWLSKYPRFSVSRNVLRLIWLCGMIGAGLSCATGYLLSLSGDYEEELISWHMWMALLVFVLSVIIFSMVSRKLNGLIYTIFLFLLLILIMITGHLGGSLTHGTDYLSSPLNNNATSDEFVQKPIPDIKEARVYPDIVRPILQTNCYGCHGRQRQKGGLRLDDSTWIAKGGKDGFIIHPFKPSESELVKRLLLPLEDEHRMPPKEKKPLSKSDIAIIQWWVAEGADFSKKVKDLSRTPKIDAMLLKKQAGQETKDLSADLSLVPVTPVDAADPKDIALLEAKKVQVIPVASNSHYLSANFINAVDITDRDLALLVPLRKQLVWLKLGDQPVGDSAMVYVGQCSALTVLQLNHTGITDLGMQSLKDLHNLHVLNLVGTRVTAAGILAIKNLQQLNNVFLYKTKFSVSDWQLMQKNFPKTTLDSGGYSVPFAAWDTVDEMRPKTKM